MRSIRPLAILALTFAAVLSFARTKPAHPELLVSTEWLANHLKDANLVLVEIGPRRSDYEASHIPTARFLPTEKIAAEHDSVRNELLPVDQLIANLEALGISNKSRVVIYASQYPTVATRLYWTLDYLGIARNASLLDGGIAQWKSENRPLAQTSKDRSLSQQNEVATRKRKLHPKLNTSLLAGLSDVQAAQTNGSVLLDSRPPKRYTDGHIAGAVPLYWQETVAREPLGKFLDADSIARAYTDAGVKPGATIVTYCDTGMQATHTYFTAKYLGYHVKMYDGSFNEWNDVKHQPVVTGDKPR